MLFIRTYTTKSGRRAQVLLRPCRCWEPWVGRRHTDLQSAGNSSRESVTPFLSSKLLQDFLVRKQLCTLFLLSNIKDINTKTSFCTVGATTKWELPGFSVRTSWLCLSSLWGVCAAPHSLEIALHTRPLAPTWCHSCVGHQLLHMQQPPTQGLALLHNYSSWNPLFALQENCSMSVSFFWWKEPSSVKTKCIFMPLLFLFVMIFWYPHCHAF